MFLSFFQVISLEGWTDIMYYIQDAHSFWDWIYFVLLIVIGSFFMINLCLVVIATQFSETKKREIERMKQERARYHSTSTIASGSMSEQLSCYAEIIKYLAHLYRRARSRVRVKYMKYKKRWIEEKPPKKLSLRRKKRKKLFEVPQGPIVSYGENTGGSVIVPRGHFTSGPLSVYNKTGSIPPPNIITPPEIHEPLELQINIPPTPTENPDFELSTVPRRPGLLQIPSCGIIESTTNGELLTPSPPGTGGANSPRRRRSSVMFSEVILLHGHPGDSRNVCLSEKTTQTEPEEPLDPSVFLSNPPPKNCVRASPMQEPKGNLTCGELLALSGALSAALPAHMGVDAQSVQTLYSSLAKGVKHFSAPSLFYPDVPPNSFSENSSSCESFTDSDGSDVEWSDEEESEPTRIKRAFTWMRSWVKKLVEHRYFNRGILIAILINTLSMGVEYHDQPEELTHFVEVSNTIFSGLFALEMFLKVVAEGPFGYISNGFNVFDGVI
ncbi:Sodium channel protein type 4 subunit alpha A, partial [Armadillidium vulgare]